MKRLLGSFLAIGFCLGLGVGTTGCTKKETTVEKKETTVLKDKEGKVVDVKVKETMSGPKGTTVVTPTAPPPNTGAPAVPDLPPPPKVEPKKEDKTPIVPPKVEKTDAPKVDAPKADAPKTDLPKLPDPPKSDLPKSGDGPKLDLPKDEPKKGASLLIRTSVELSRLEIVVSRRLIA